MYQWYKKRNKNIKVHIVNRKLDFIKGFHFKNFSALM